MRFTKREENKLLLKQRRETKVSLKHMMQYTSEARVISSQKGERKKQMLVNKNPSGRDFKMN